MFTGILELDLLLGDVHSLKEKRTVVRPIVSEVRRRFEVAVAEVGHLQLHRRSLIGVAVVAPDAAHCRRVLDACERWVVARPEIEVLSAHQRLVGDDDEFELPGVGGDEPSFAQPRQRPGEEDQR